MVQPYAHMLAVSIVGATLDRRQRLDMTRQGRHSVPKFPKAQPMPYTLYGTRRFGSLAIELALGELDIPYDFPEHKCAA